MFFHIPKCSFSTSRLPGNPNGSSVRLIILNKLTIFNIFVLIKCNSIQFFKNRLFNAFLLLFKERKTEKQ